MASGSRVGPRPDCRTFLCKFWHFQMAVSQWKPARLTPNLGILWISVCSFWLCESIVANPIIYRLVPRPSRFETRQLDFSKGNPSRERSIQNVIKRWRNGENVPDYRKKWAPFLPRLQYQRTPIWKQEGLCWFETFGAKQWHVLWI